MGIRAHVNSVNSQNEMLQDKLFREEKAYRQDRLVEKWSKVAEIGKGMEKMETSTARNLATLLENQARSMSRMTEAQLNLRGRFVA